VKDHIGLGSLIQYKLLELSTQISYFVMQSSPVLCEEIEDRYKKYKR